MYLNLVTILLATSLLCSPLLGQSNNDSPPAAGRIFEKLKLEPREQAPKAADTDSQFLILPLKKLSVQTAIAAIEKFHPDMKLIIDGDIETNQLWLRGDQSSLQKVQAFVDVLEEAAPAKPTGLEPTSFLSELRGQEQDSDSRGSESFDNQSTQAMDLKTAPVKSQRAVDSSIRQQEMQTIELATQVRQGSKQRSELHDAVAAAFRMKQDSQGAELESLQQRVDTLARQIDAREKSAVQIISQRVEDLLNPELDWQILPPIRAGALQSTAQPNVEVSPEPKVGAFKITGIDSRRAYDVVATMLSGEEGVRLALDTKLDRLLLKGTDQQHERVRKTLQVLSDVNSQADYSVQAKASVTIRLSEDGKALQLQSNSKAELQRVEDALHKLPDTSTAKHGAVQIESIPELDLVVVRGEKAAVQSALNIIDKLKSEAATIQSDLSKAKHDTHQSPNDQTAIELSSASETEDSAVPRGER